MGALEGCKSRAAFECEAEFQNAQIVVQNGASTLEGFETSLTAVDKALGGCKVASRDKEVEQLNLVRKALTIQIETVKSRAPRPKRVKPTPAELDELVKHGDPKCPKGMAYNVEGSDRQIKCTGLQPIRMSWHKASDYYSNLGFHVVTTNEPPAVRAEHGSELYVFTYSRVEDTQAPRCLTIYPDANIPWQEAVSRATGASINKLKEGSPVPTAEGEVALRIDSGPNKLVVYLGKCGA